MRSNLILKKNNVGLFSWFAEFKIELTATEIWNLNETTLEFKAERIKRNSRKTINGK